MSKLLEKYQNLLVIKISVDVEKLKLALEHEFADYDDSYNDLSDAVDEFVQEVIERPTAEKFRIDHGEANLDELLCNLEEFRDCVSDFLYSKED